MRPAIFLDRDGVEIDVVIRDGVRYLVISAERPVKGFGIEFPARLMPLEETESSRFVENVYLFDVEPGRTEVELRPLSSSSS